MADEEPEEESPVSVSGGILPSCSFSTLPDEIIIKVFGLLDIYELVKIAEVSKRWNELIKTLSLWKTRRFHSIGEEKWLLDPLGELMDFTDVLCEMEEKSHGDEDSYAYEEGGIGPRSKITLLLRLHPKHENLTREISPACESWEDVDPQFRQLLGELWSTFGRHACKGKRRFIEWGGYESDDESDSETENKCGCSITSAEDVLRKRQAVTKEEAIKFILDALDPGPDWSNYQKEDQYNLDEDEEIVEEEPSKSGKKYKFERLSLERLFSKVRKLFADKSSHFMMYNLSDACFSLAPFPYDCYATQLLVSETAAFFYNQFYSIV